MAKKFFYASLGVFMTLSAQAFAAPPDALRIGMSQYPSTLHPMYDEMVAKSLVLGATLRPVTAYDAAWKLTWMWSSPAARSASMRRPSWSMMRWIQCRRTARSGHLAMSAASFSGMLIW